MNRRIVSIVLLVGIAVGGWGLWSNLGAARLPGNDQGYEPQQPIAFSHRLHAGELGIDCLYCHGGAEKSRHAGIPAASTCMNCHKFVTAPLGAIREAERLAKEQGVEAPAVLSPELARLYDALGLNEQMKPDPSKTPKPIEWTQVHSLPAYVYFDHSRHVNAGVSCLQCHGDVQGMERVRQVESLSMGWCVNCHRDVNARGINGKPVAASTDCAACHY